MGKDPGTVKEPSLGPPPPVLYNRLVIKSILIALILGLTGCASAPRGGPSGEAEALIRIARAYLPEQGGRPTPEDCSDFVGKVFAERGRPLPRDSRQMSRLGAPVRRQAALRAGDLVFFTGSSGKGGVGHVGIYLSGRSFIHLGKKAAGVRVESLDLDYYRSRYLFGRRVLK